MSHSSFFVCDRKLNETKVEEISSGLACLCFAASTYRIQSSPSQLIKELNLGEKPTTTSDILLASQHLGLATNPRSFKGLRWEDVKIPAILEWPGQQYRLLMRLDNETAVVFDPETPQIPLVLNQTTLQENAPVRLMELSLKESRISTRRTSGLGWLMSPLTAHRATVVEILVASLAVQMFALAMPLFSQVIIDKVLMHRNLSTLHVLGIGMIFLIAFEGTFSVLRTRLLAHMASRADALLGTRVVSHLLRLPLRYFESQKIGNTISKIRELESIRQFITGSSFSGLVDLLFTVVFLMVMLQYNVVLTCVVMAVLPALVGFSFILRPAVRRCLAEKYEKTSAANTLLLEAVSGIHAIKALAVESSIQDKWRAALAAQVTASFRSAHINGMSNAFNHLMQRATTLAVLWMGAYMAVRGELSVGQVIAFQMLALRAINPMMRLAQIWQEFQQMLLASQELGKIMNAEPEVESGQSRKLTSFLVGSVALQGIVFSYSPAMAPVINDLSLKAEPGQVIGIVGRSGCGKSTLAKLLHRLYAPDSGAILIDDMDIRHYDPLHLRRQISVVPQDIFLFSGSIRDNICMRHPTADLESIIVAARAADAHGFVSEFPQGYDTVVGERGGILLSGGQRQKIAIARALHAQPKILILDEATSALDYEAERKVQDGIRRICANCTVFVIAHRLSTVRDADKILVLDKGKFIEEGTHSELMSGGGLYRQLYSQQNFCGDGRKYAGAP